MGQWSYFAILGFVIVGSFWLEFALRTRVLRRWKRLFIAIAPGVILFMIWDMYAVSAGHWWFDTARITGVYLPAKVPLEEFVFFIIIPIAAILTLEAVRSVKPHWFVPDQPDES